MIDRLLNGRHGQKMDADSNENAGLRGKIAGWTIVALALPLFLALLSYKWEAMPQLCLPPLSPTPNLAGALGDGFVYHGMAIFGLAVFCIPVMVAFAGILVVLGASCKLRRVFYFFLFTISLACFFQLLNSTALVRSVLEKYNAGLNGGGNVGYLIVTRLLIEPAGAFATSLLVLAATVLTLLLALGIANVKNVVKSIWAWALRDRTATDNGDAAVAAGLDVIDAVKKSARENQEAERERLDREMNERAQRLREKMKAAAELKRNPPKPPPPPEPVAEPPEPKRPPKPRRETPPPPPPPTPASTENAVPQGDSPYVIPPISLLNPLPKEKAEHGDVEAMGQRIVNTLHEFGIESQLAYNVPGPVVTQYAITTAPTVKISSVTTLADNIQMALEAKSLRIEAPIPGQNAIGFEVPNKKSVAVFFRQIVEGRVWNDNSFQIPLLLGKDAQGGDLVVDLAKMPHLLVAGATGQGKSVCLNSIINGLLMCRTPQQLKLILVDPKRVEFTAYNRLPHLLLPVINDTQKVVFALQWAVKEMNNRLKMFNKVSARNIVDFNTRKKTQQQDLFGEESPSEDESSIPATVPYIVLILDEVADIMLTEGKTVEPLIAKLAALSRATGIHLILATQRPDTKTISGTLKSNIPGRIAFKTSQGNDSRTILDAVGAEKLIGKGDMLFKTPEGSLIRAQGAYISDPEINRILDFIAEHSPLQLDEKLTQKMNQIKEQVEDDDDSAGNEDGSNGGEEAAPYVSTSGFQPPPDLATTKEKELWDQAIEVLRTTKRASVSHLQRRMRIGYNHASRLIDCLQDAGIVGPPSGGANSREILVDLDNVVPVYDGGEDGQQPSGETPADAGQEEEPLPESFSDNPFEQ